MFAVPSMVEVSAAYWEWLLVGTVSAEALVLSAAVLLATRFPWSVGPPSRRTNAAARSVGPSPSWRFVRSLTRSVS